MVIAQGDIFWADSDEPKGSEPGFRRPVIVVQGNSANRSRIATVLCVPLTTNLKWADAPGNVLIGKSSSKLGKDSVANVSQLTAVDREVLTEKVGRLSPKLLSEILTGIDVMLGR